MTNGTITAIATHVERAVDRTTHGHRAAVDRHARVQEQFDRRVLCRRSERGECTRRRDQERGRRAAELRRTSALEA